MICDESRGLFLAHQTQAWHTCRAKSRPLRGQYFCLIEDKSNNSLACNKRRCSRSNSSLEKRFPTGKMLTLEWQRCVLQSTAHPEDPVFVEKRVQLDEFAGLLQAPAALQSRNFHVKLSHLRMLNNASMGILQIFY